MEKGHQGKDCRDIAEHLGHSRNREDCTGQE